MRGTVAKILRGQAGGDRGAYRALKKLHKLEGSFAGEPKLEENPRWLRSPLHRSKMPAAGRGLYLVKMPLMRELGDVFGFLDAKGKRMALTLDQQANWLPRIELVRRVNALVATTK